MKYSIRPLTKIMIRKLQECREIEIKFGNNQPVPQEHFKNCFAGLYNRGFIELKKYTVNGKELTGACLTADAIKFLDYLENEKKG